MDEITHTDTFEAGFVAGWFRARGIFGQPTIEQVQEAAGDFYRFTAELARSASDAIGSRLAS